MRRSGHLASVALAVLFTAAAGLPGFEARSTTPEIRPEIPPDIQPEIRLMAMTQLKAGSGGHFITTADINGREVKVLVDTGATVVALSYEDAENVGLKPHTLDYTIPVSTANGVAKAARVKLKFVMIDNLKVRDVDGMVLPEGTMRGTLLGMSFLSRLKSFTISDGKLILKN